MNKYYYFDYPRVGSRLVFQKKMMILATWNVQESRRKVEIIASEIEKLNLDIISSTETKKKSPNSIGEYVHIQSFR